MAISSGCIARPRCQPFVWSSLRAPPPGELAEALPRKDKTRATPGFSLRAPPSGELADGHDPIRSVNMMTANRSLDWPAPSQCGAVMVRPLAGWALRLLRVAQHPQTELHSRLSMLQSIYTPMD